jgi:hypothetical protein
MRVELTMGGLVVCLEQSQQDARVSALAWQFDTSIELGGVPICALCHRCTAITASSPFGMVGDRVRWIGCTPCIQED